MFSDERFHIIGGNQQVPTALSERLMGPIKFGRTLIAARKKVNGQIELNFDKGKKAVHDAVVITVPFSVLREVDIHASLGIPVSKQSAINNMVYGNNAKMHVGFDGPFWAEINGNGITYSDLPNHQLTWEVNPSNASGSHATLVDYSGGERGLNLQPDFTNDETELFLLDLNQVYDGAYDSASRTNSNKFLSHLKHWPSDLLVKGSYVCNHLGYFTTISGIEGTPVDNLYFAGDHTDSFYEWQGYMEGAANSGIRAAGEILSDFRLRGGGKG